MINKQAETAKNTSSPPHQGDQATLVDCYGAIGISAVAAAARYQGASKNQAYAPATLKTGRWTADDAA